MANNEVSLNISPQIPEGALNVSPAFRERVARGLSLILYEYQEEHPSGYGEGQERLLRNFAVKYKPTPGLEGEKMLMPAVWMLAHAYLGSDRAKRFMEDKMIISSSARVIRPRKHAVYIAHNVLAERNYDRHSLTPTGQFKVDSEGLAFCLDKLDYPDKPVFIDQLINEYAPSAKALFLMDDAQLHKLLLRVPQGTMFSDRADARESQGYSFGGSPKEPFFGVTISTEANGTTYPIRLGERDEIEVTYSPRQFLELSRALGALKQKQTPENIARLERAVRISD